MSVFHHLGLRLKNQLSPDTFIVQSIKSLFLHNVVFSSLTSIYLPQPIIFSFLRSLIYLLLSPPPSCHLLDSHPCISASSLWTPERTKTAHNDNIFPWKSEWLKVLPRSFIVVRFKSKRFKAGFPLQHSHHFLTSLSGICLLLSSTNA